MDALLQHANTAQFCGAEIQDQEMASVVAQPSPQAPAGADTSAKLMGQEDLARRLRRGSVDRALAYEAADTIEALEQSLACANRQSDRFEEQVRQLGQALLVTLHSAASSRELPPAAIAPSLEHSKGSWESCSWIWLPDFHS
jgi:hypothetical protein